MKRTALKGLFVAGLACLCTSASFAQEVYKATLSTPRGLGVEQAVLTVTIRERSTEEDTARFQKILSEEGSDALIRALRQLDRGTAQIEGGRTERVNHVRVFPGENGSRVIIVTEHPLELPSDSLEPKAPPENAVGFIQLELNNQGQGRGRLAEALGVRITDEGVMQITASRAKPIDLTDVRREQ